MLTEMLGKGGQVCRYAKEGRIKCPLIVRPTSEDVVTGHLFQGLGAINPRWWLPQVVNRALGAERLRQQVYRKFKIELWKNRPPYPRELLPWDEGSTQVDATITWENPPTTLFFEMKYGSDLAARTTGNDGQHGFPADQLIRNIRVGLLECGWFRGPGLFDSQPRDFIVTLVTPTVGHPLVEAYRNERRLRASIPYSDRLTGIPGQPFLGEIGYSDVVQVLKRQRRWTTRPEQVLIDNLADYLQFKKATLRDVQRCEQRGLGFTSARHSKLDLEESESASDPQLA